MPRSRPTRNGSAPKGRELTWQEKATQNLFENDVRQLREVDPENPARTRLQPPGWLPMDVDVARMDDVLQKAKAAKSGSDAQDTRDRAAPDDLLFPKQHIRAPTYALGQSDGGPGVWVVSSKYPSKQADAA